MRTAIFLLAALFGFGCATNGSVEDVSARLDALEVRLAIAEDNATQALERSLLSEDIARDAAESAAQYAHKAEENFRRAEAAFSKSVSK
jgi:hypothetical protein